MAISALVAVALAGGTQPFETYESKVARDAPVAQFRFSDAAGSSTLADSAGSYTASNSGITLGGEGPFGGSLSGDFGGAAFATLPADPLTGSAFTAEAWVDWTGGSSYGQPVFDFGSGSTNYMYLTPASPATKHQLLFELHTSAGTATVVAKKTLPAGAWEYVAVSESSAGALTLYLNGAVAGEAAAGSITPASLGGTVPGDYLGKSLISGAPLFQGNMSNVAFYNKVLTGEQIKEHYDAGEFPVNVNAPTVTGMAKEGSALAATEGTWTGLAPIKFAYKWEACSPSGKCEGIAKATKATYTVGGETVGQTLRVAVTGSNAAGEGIANSTQTATVEGKPANTALPAISGKAEVGQALTVSDGSWRAFPEPAFTYQWETCNSKGKTCTSIEKASKAGYRVIASELGKTLRAVVTASNSLGASSATTEATAAVTAGPPVNVELPTVSGSTEEGQELTATAGHWAGSEPIEYSYQWQRCNGGKCNNISGASGAKYTKYKLTASDVGNTIEVLVTAKNSVGEASVVSLPTQEVTVVPPVNITSPVVSGTAQDGQTLSASTGTWSGTPPLSYSYQWEG
ncbi:MAG: LamG-like jellyroll fold domain-containing protein [Solirubrobacteraceae bacterium]